MANLLTYDFLAIGSGVAGNTAAILCAKEGLKTAIVDNKPYGGTCPLRGSDPKKILLGAAELYDWFTRMKDKGVVSGDVNISWENLIEYKSNYTDNIPSKIEKHFGKLKIDSFNAGAEFIDKNRVKIGEYTVEADKILISTGSVPTKLPFEGAELMSSSDDFLSMEHLPEKILFVGGGFISLEFAQAAARAGAESIVVHSGKRILEAFDNELVSLLTDAAKESGINIITGNRVNRIKKDKSMYIAELSNSDEEINADMIVHGAGRTANVFNMNLENAGIEYSKNGITINDYLQNTGNPSVYAAGDVSDSRGSYLATVASMEGRTAAENIINGNSSKPCYENIPSVVFTIPAIGTVGMTEKEAEKKEFLFESRFQKTADWFTSYRVGEKHSGYKIIKDKETDKLLGTHLIGRTAEEVINLFSFALNKGITAKELKNMVYAYPTASSDIFYML